MSHSSSSEATRAHVSCLQIAAVWHRRRQHWPKQYLVFELSVQTRLAQRIRLTDSWWTHEGLRKHGARTVATTSLERCWSNSCRQQWGHFAGLSVRFSTRLPVQLCLQSHISKCCLHQQPWDGKKGRLGDFWLLGTHSSVVQPVMSANWDLYTPPCGDTPHYQLWIWRKKKKQLWGKLLIEVAECARTTRPCVNKRVDWEIQSL